MSTPHISAQMGDFAKTVLMPGDPLRAKYIAENFLENPRLVTDVRGMLGYTGTYQGRPISVMGSGMGQPSIGIYSYELYTQYGVENIVRIGTAGSYVPEVKVMDVVLATSAFSESTFALVQSGVTEDELPSSSALNDAIRASAAKMGIKMHEGCTHSSDVFYPVNHPDEAGKAARRAQHHCLCVEMESFALFANARALGKQATCLITISDSFVTPEIISAEVRQKGLNDMIKIALNAEY